MEQWNIVSIVSNIFYFPKMHFFFVQLNHGFDLHLDNKIPKIYRQVAIFAVK